MKTHIEDDRLQDYVDGQLGAAERAAVGRHLGECAACRRAENELRTLLGQLSALPLSIEPARDLRPAIHTAMAGTLQRRFTERTIRSSRLALAAAAVLLVMATSTLTVLVVRNSGRDALVLTSDAWPDAAERFRAVEANYVAATDELERTLRDGRAELAPETVRLLEENLRIIDGALAEASAALRSDPNNLALSEMLTAAYEKKLDLLRRAAQPAPIRGGV